MTTTAIFQIAIELEAALICAIIVSVLLVGRKTMSQSNIHMVEILVIVAALLTADSLAYIFRGDPSFLGVIMTRSSNFLVYFFQYWIAINFTLLLSSLIEEYGGHASKNFLRVQILISAADIFLLIISQFNGFFYYFDDTNHYVRGPGILLSMGLGAAVFVLNGCMTMHYKKYLPKKVFQVSLVYLTLPFASLILQTIFYGFSFINISIAFIFVLMFAVNESERIKKFEEQLLLLAKQEQELTEQRIQLVTSQIQPHFLFNALSTISSLCSIDPKLAETAVDRFADYLRINLDTIGTKKLITFSAELKHTQTYLWLEQLRFGDLLHVEYDIRESDFMLPPLVLQPVVENAVKHGVCKKESGGTVTIMTRKEGNDIYITVKDDGVGFDPSAPLSKERSHVGVNNVKHRLETLCDGSLTIDSTPGVGTTATILIKENATNEHITG